MNTPWWPSKYGQDDQIGTLNEIMPAKVVEAARLVREGRIFDLSHPLDQHVPAFPGRSFRQSLHTAAHQQNRRRPDSGGEGWGAENINWVIDVVYGTSQMGTHLDGLNHLQRGDRFYNGYRMDEIVEDWGTNKLGIETVPQIVTRGVLVNVAALKGVVRLNKGYVIIPEDVAACLSESGLGVTRGDAVLFHTGWGAQWMADNGVEYNSIKHSSGYLSGEPGPGLALAEWLVEQGVSVSGCDTWSYGVVPPEDPSRPFFVPQMLNVKYGMFIVENLKTAKRAEAMSPQLAVEFMFVLTHAKVRGATGAWVAPVAIL